ncbi:hypothetical protein [Raoultibacter timonensis]|uniref:Uncharacterized protein n=3 Tax=Raoultibacter timonensis TaxID=1907662 RepID=A0ABN6MME6_9ACTN|nr:hypothetical protein [Raoultibacter timonensis]BDE97421.1 hypothetical protein CE91St30_27540 [Raoultibacter timonensis]BDF52024.1 hypothetical protein CE91St31_27540 [Raoultibacter timonensis]
MHRYSESMGNASDDLRQKARNAAKLGGVLFCLCAAASAVLAAESKDALSVLLALAAPASCAVLAALAFGISSRDETLARGRRLLRVASGAAFCVNLATCLAVFAIGSLAYATQICSIACAAYCIRLIALSSEDAAFSMQSPPQKSALKHPLAKHKLMMATILLWIVSVVAGCYAAYSWGNLVDPKEIGFANAMALASIVLTALLTSTVRSLIRERTSLNQWLFERDCRRIAYTAGVITFCMIVVGNIPAFFLAAVYLLSGLYLRFADLSGLGPVRNAAAARPSDQSDEALPAADEARKPPAPQYAIAPKHRLVIQTIALAVALAATIAFVLSPPVQQTLANPGMVVLNICFAVAPSAIFIAAAAIVALNASKPTWKWVVAIATFAVAFVHGISLSSSFLQGQFLLGTLTTIVAIVTFSFGDTVADADELTEYEREKRRAAERELARKSREEARMQAERRIEPLRAEQRARFAHLYELLDVPAARDIEEVLPHIGEEWGVPLEEAQPSDAMIALYDHYAAVEYDWKLEANDTLWLYREMLETHAMFDSLLDIELIEDERCFDPDESAESLLHKLLARQCDSKKRALMLDAGNDSVVTVVVKTADLLQFRSELADILPRWSIVSEGDGRE